jgi:hypothetical protein
LQQRNDDPDYEIPKQEMLRIRSDVRSNLLTKLHQHLLLGRALRKAGKLELAAQENAQAVVLKTMIKSLDGSPLDEDYLPNPVRLQETDDGA